jgi:hypothetical protein
VLAVYQARDVPPDVLLSLLQARHAAIRGVQMSADAIRALDSFAARGELYERAWREVDNAAAAIRTFPPLPGHPLARPWRRFKFRSHMDRVRRKKPRPR